MPYTPPPCPPPPGVLLRRLLSEPTLAGVTHVVVDEVHERSTDSDLLLLLLRNLVWSPKGRHLRIVLMSATADPGLFADYFSLPPTAELAAAAAALVAGGAGGGGGGGAAVGRVPVALLTIPGFTYPVRDLFLEDVLQLTAFEVGRNSR